MPATLPLRSTEFYRKNRLEKKVIHKCPHCDYVSYNSKICVENHINAKHMDESKRPFQCKHCSRGFSQKAHLHCHMKKQHGIEVEEKKIISIAYIISITDNIPTSKKTLSRYNFYKKNTVIYSHLVNENKYEYMNNVYLKQHDIHYDFKKEFISLKKCPLWGKKNKRCD
jgi:hypothetical protein